MDLDPATGTGHAPWPHTALPVTHKGRGTVRMEARPATINNDADRHRYGRSVSSGH
jgi:hypothetical protein